MTSVDRIQGLSGGIAIKVPCRVATTANITLSGEQTIDGIAVVDGDRVLVKDQSTGAENGIYEASTGSWTRAPDFDGDNDVVMGTQTTVNFGTTNANTLWRVTTPPAITIGTTSIAFGAALQGVQGEVGRLLASPEDFLDVPKDAADYWRKTSGLHRDSVSDSRPAWGVRDGNYVSARWPGDMHGLMARFIELLPQSAEAPPSPPAPLP